MPIVNYVREHIRFMEYATDEHLTASERLLWYALMHIMNQRAQGKVWPDEFIRISNDRLLSYCPMKYDTIAAARNSLKQRGLIEYTKGDKNRLSPAYRVNYFYPEYVAPDTESDEVYPEKSDKNGFYPKNSDYIGGNMGGNIGGNMGGNMGGNTGDFILNNKGIRNRNPKYFEDDEEDEEDSFARARAREEVNAAWKTFFGKAANPAVADGIAWRAVQARFEEGIITKAVELAAHKCAGSPFDYIITVLSDWRQQKVRTMADADEYGFLWDATEGKLKNSVYADGAYDRLRAFREDRETDEERESRERYEAQEEKERRERQRRIDQNKEEREKEEYEREKAKLDRKYLRAVND